MSLLQTTAEEEKQDTYRSTTPDATATEEAAPVSDTANATSLDEIPLNARHVRPDELMAALAAIDARKNATVAGTVSLGAALEQMQADATPDEVWLEIYAGRLQQRKAGVQVQSGDTLRRKRFWVTSGVLVGVFAVAILLRMAVGDVRSVNSETTGVATAPVTPPKPKLPTRNMIPVQDPLQLKSPNSVSLAQLLQENRTVWMDIYHLSGFKTLIYGNRDVLPLPAAKRSTIYFNPDVATHGDWITSFRNNRLYIRGWIKAPQPGQNMTQMLVQKTRLYNHPTHPDLAGKSARQITIPADGIQNYSASSDGLQSSMDLRITHLDGEAWKSWEAPPLPDFAGPVTQSSGGLF